MSQISDLDSFEKQNIKEVPISADELDYVRGKMNSYEALFNKRARKFQQSEYKSMNLKDEDYRNLILQEYTFLKRPVMLIGEQVFVGNSPSVVQNMLETANQ